MDKHDQILKQIKHNSLNGHPYEFVIAQLCVLNNKPFTEMKELVDDLIETEELLKNNSGEVVITNLESLMPSNKFSKSTKGHAYSPYMKRSRQEKGDVKRVKVLEGKIQGTKGHFAFFIPFDSSFEDVYINQNNLNGALNGDSVVVEVFKTKRGLEGSVLEIVERGYDKIVGKISIQKGVAFVVCDDVKFGKDVYIPMSKTLGAENGDKVVVKIDKYYSDNKNPEGHIVEVLGKPNTIETEVLALIRSYNLYEEFPKKVVEAAAKAPTEINRNEIKGNRLDLTKELIFTIDGEDARDLDDAISLSYDEKGNQVLGVHIADVGEYVKLHSTLDQEAFKRATSVYFPSLVLPMLPKQLSNGICSLNEMVERLTVSVFITYNAKAEMIDYSIHESIIKSKKRFTYTEVDKVLQNDPVALEHNKAFAQTLFEMNELSKKLIKLREKRGAIDFDLPEVKIGLNDLGDVLTIQKRERNDSHKLIESFMIAANEAIAQHFNKHKLPFVYRVHEKPEMEKMQNFLSFIKSLGITDTFYAESVSPKDIQKVISKITDEDLKYVVNRICLRSLKKAKYYPECLGHFGLASTYYTHFTSPIRRYPDLTIHRIIKAYLRNELNDKVISELKHFVPVASQVSSDREVIAEKVERDVDDLYKAVYMSHHLGEEFEGRINSVTPYGVYVELENTVEGLLRIEDLPTDQYKYYENAHMLQGFYHTYKIGQNVKVKAIRSDINSREIDFMLA